ncbi:MAG: hypothetical protein LBB48_01550 [Treponema sp.]|jgi:hypothetical protein|nr:hypothetical protein [Treponema sp.]
MAHTFTLTSFGEKWHFKTDHYLDMDVRRVFEDLLSIRNTIRWDEMDTENFLATEGRLVSECITQLQPDKNDTIPSVLAAEKFKNIEKIIVCVYSHSVTMVDDYGKVLEQVSAVLPVETQILSGWIRDEKATQNGVTIKLIAICME